MKRMLNVAGVAVAVAAAGAVYDLKLEANRAFDKVAALQREIQRERDTIAVLKAEWAQLNQPGRIQALANRHLDVKPLGVLQIVRPTDVPEREAPAPAGAPAAARVSAR